MKPMKKRPIWHTVIALAITRTILNFTRRFAYPFVPEIARQFQVDIATIQSLLGWSALVGITSPFFDPLSEQFGRKRVMLGTMVIAFVTSVVGLLLPQFTIFAIAIILYGWVKMIFDPAAQTYMADRIPYAQRARAYGVFELSWALSLLIGAPLTGFLLGLWGMQSVFVFFSVVFAIAIYLVWRYVDNDRPQHESSRASPGSVRRRVFANIRNMGRTLVSSKQVMAFFLFVVLVVIGNEIFFINYGNWLEESFGLAVEAIGAVTIVIAIADVVGEFSVAAWADRIGKRRFVLFGTTITAICYGLIPLLSSSLPLAMAGMFVLFIGVEISIVTSIVLISEILPDSRATMLSLNIAAHALARFVGAQMGRYMFQEFADFRMIGAAASILILIAIIMMWVFVPEAGTAIEES